MRVTAKMRAAGRKAGHMAAKRGHKRTSHKRVTHRKAKR